MSDLIKRIKFGFNNKNFFSSYWIFTIFRNICVDSVYKWASLKCKEIVLNVIDMLSFYM